MDGLDWIALDWVRSFRELYGLNWLDLIWLGDCDSVFLIRIIVAYVIIFISNYALRNFNCPSFFHDKKSALE